MHFQNSPIEGREFSAVCTVPCTVDSAVTFRINQYKLATASYAKGECEVELNDTRYEVLCSNTRPGSVFTLTNNNFSSQTDIGHYQCSHKEDEVSLSLKPDLGKRLYYWLPNLVLLLKSQDNTYRMHLGFMYTDADD